MSTQLDSRDNRESIDRVSLLFSIVLLVVITLISGSMAIYVVSDSGIKDAINLMNAAIKIKNSSSEVNDYDEIIRKARSGMFASFDRYTSYVSKSQFETIDEEFTGEYSGIGISVVKDEKGLLVMSVRENSPAKDKGLSAGDVILSVDSILLADVSISDASSMLRGKSKSEVDIIVLRQTSTGDDTLNLIIPREQIPLLRVPFAGIREDSILYIRLLNFEMGASEDISSALDSLLGVDGKLAKGIILDLRGNPGGLFSEALRVSDLFLDKGEKIAGTEGKSIWESEQYFSNHDDKSFGLPMAVLVDDNSASSAEITAGALSQSGRAILVGDTTFGKGLVQGFIKLPDGDGLRITISRYYVGDSLFLNRFDSTLKEDGQGLIPTHYFDYNSRAKLLTELENSLILHRFVFKNKREIVATEKSTNSEKEWVQKLNVYAEESGFSYISKTTTMTEILYISAVYEQSSRKLSDIARKLNNKSKSLDGNAYLNAKSQIFSRMKEIALEAELGSYFAYKNFKVKEMPIINYAASLLKETRKMKVEN